MILSFIKIRLAVESCYMLLNSENLCFCLRTAPNFLLP
jgi:hypothetical protein